MFERGVHPLQSLLDSSEHYHQAKEQFATHGIEVGSLGIDFPQMIARKGEVVSQTTEGINFLMKKNNIDVHHGLGSFVDAHTIAVTPAKGKPTQIGAKHVIIATGSKPSTLPFIDVDKKRVITSTEARACPSCPNP